MDNFNDFNDFTESLTPDLVLQAYTSCFNEPILYSKNHRQSENSHSENQENLEQVPSLLVMTQTDERNEDDNFDDWDRVQIVIDAFARQNGFVANKSKKIHLTKINNIYNHEYGSNAITFAPKHFRLSQEILNKVEHYTVVEQLGAGQQYNLLSKEFPEVQIRRKNLYNAIQKFRGAKNHDENDTVKLLQKLFKERQNVKKKAKAKLLAEMAKTFVTDFFQMRNSFSKDQFEITELVDIIQKELEKEASYTRIRDYYGSNPSVGLPSTYTTIFKPIDQVLQTMLSPIPLSLQRAQIKQSLLYVATLINPNEIHNIEYDFNDFIEYDYKASQIQIDQLLDNISSESIHELWKVTCIAFNALGFIMFNAMFHTSMIHPRWYDDNAEIKSTSYVTIYNGVVNSTKETLPYFEHIRAKSVYILAIHNYVSKKIQVGNAISIAKTCVQTAFTENTTSDLIGVMVQCYNEQDHNPYNNEQYGDKFKLPLEEVEVDSNLHEVSNPEYHKPRGHPPKRLKSSIEISTDKYTESIVNSQDTVNLKTCGYCKEKGYNIRSCKQYKETQISDKEN
ncbi:hypothetical protein C2G38_2181881 [Gigaspora rosea]|uniref:Uncharacterized protein n=1 Tax=Gigaspora rosea TaxID=44941 RepID=A0A397VEM3_9GLOM|nr:hypothetical protein C2G38_2181881 [Gigaspora rosea]